MIASACSPLGFASEASGSIRTPCLFNGIYGFAITPGRVTVKGVVSPGYGAKEYVSTTIGVMGRSTRDLQLVVKNFVSSEVMIEYDFYVESRVWNDYALRLRDKFKIAIFPENKFFELTEGQKRVMLVSINKLAERGHAIVPFTFQTSYNLVEVFLEIASQMLGATKEEFKDDFMVGEFQFIQKYHSPTLITKAVQFVQGFFTSSPRIEYFTKLLKERKLDGFLSLFEVYQQHLHDLNFYLKKEEIDAILIPGLSVAYNKGTSSELAITHFSHLFPCAGKLCAGAVPVDFSKPGEESYSDTFDDAITIAVKNNLKKSSGLPLGIQVCSARNQDEKCLTVMAIIEDIFKFKHIAI